MIDKITNIFNNKYEIYDNVVYFRNNFNGEIDTKLRNKLSKYDKIVFMNSKSYKLYKYYNFSNYIYIKYPTYKNIFNKSADNFPITIKQLKFGYSFNQPVERLPSLLENLKFCYEFNQYVNNLPPLLLNLEFGRNFNKPVDNLPYLLQNIKFGFKFNQSVNKLPIFISNIIFESFNYGNIMINKLPEYINTLEFTLCLPDKQIKKIPKMLKKLIFSDTTCLKYEIDLHENLEYLEIHAFSIEKLNFDYNCRLNSLFLHSYNHKLTYLPKSIKILKLALCDDNTNLLNNLSNSIEELELFDPYGFKPNFKLNNILDNLPNSIKKLNLKKTKIQIILDNLPDSIEHLYLPINYNLVINKLSKNIIIIECNKTYKFIKNLKKNKKIKIIFYNNLFN